MNRDELRRLQKAARDKDLNKLREWAELYERQLQEILRREYEKLYRVELDDSINNFLIALVYTLYFSENIEIERDNIGDFMSELFVTVDLFRLGQYKPEDYKKELDAAKVQFGNYDYSKLYKEKQQKLDHLINEYELKLNELNK